MREKISTDEASVVENISTRNRVLKASIPGENRPPGAEVPEQAAAPESEPVKEKEATRDEPKRRENKVQEYESLFFKAAAIKTRNGKVVYIRKEHHDRIMKIVRVIGENEFSLFNYLDNILEHHFATYQDEITKLYRKKNTDVF
ncbi:MAG: DUF3408 domain-containing protein [Bacteroides sp.]|nr:DUF3408 domain-containing protein [Bacteroides sp.]